jgi:hypothetical protein
VTRRSYQPIAPGDRFDRLVAVEDAGRDTRGNLRWRFTCLCGGSITTRPSNVRQWVRKIGWASCLVCYRREGSWPALVARASLAQLAESDREATVREVARILEALERGAA